ncbi:MAG: glutathione S-transferase family protein [Pseudomonadota bacterium]
MSDELVFYTNPMSRGRIARWMLEEVGAPYRTEVVDYGPAMKSANYLAINPMGKVPALKHRGAVVTEAAAICAYLADAFPDAGLAPPPSERQAYYRWLFFGAGPIEAAVTNKALGFEAPPEKSGMLGYGSFASALDVLEAAVSVNGWIAGPEFSAADVYIGAQLDFGLRFKSIEARPAFEAFAKRCQERPAYKRAAEIDDGLIAQQSA